MSSSKVKFAPTTPVVDVDLSGGDSDTDSIDSMPCSGVVVDTTAKKQPDMISVGKKGCKKRKLGTTTTKQGKASMVADEDEEPGEVVGESGPSIAKALQECVKLMVDIKRNQNVVATTAAGAPTGPTTAPGACYYCYVPDHYSSFCPLKIKHNAERLSSQKKVQKAKQGKGAGAIH